MEIEGYCYNCKFSFDMNVEDKNTCSRCKSKRIKITTNESHWQYLEESNDRD